MIGLHTNVLVRYLVQDDPKQSAAANRLIADAVAKGERLFVSSIVMCECVWVLRGAAAVGKPDVVRALDGIVTAAQFEIGDRDLVLAALEDYRDGSGDFADFLLGRQGEASGCRKTATFDKRLKKSSLFSVLAG